MFRRHAEASPALRRVLRQRGCAFQVFLGFVMVALLTRVFVLPHAVQSERWTRYNTKENEIFKEGGDPTRGQAIECPKWSGESGTISEPRGPVHHPGEK